MAQTGYTPLLIYASGTASNVPSAANLTSSASGAELALNYADGKLYFKNSSGVVTLLASAAGASGDVVGPASATDNALARFDTTTGKLIQNSVGILSDAGALSGLTDITASGNVTLSGGTANGVAYLNGSKVLTTGSALTFDGNKLAVQAGSATANRIDLLNDTGNATLRVGYDTSNNLTITRNAGDANIYLNATQSGAAQVWQLAGSEQMRLTSTGLGIGTSSPSSFSGYTTVSVNNATNGGIYNILVNGTETARLQAYSGIFNVAAKGAATNLTFETNGAERMRLDSSGNLGIGTSSPQARLHINSGAGSTQFRMGPNSTSSDRALINYNSTTNRFTIDMSGNDAVVVDGSGNLGLGVTPSAWDSTYKAIQVGARSMFYGIGSEANMANNAYYNSGYKYVANSAAGLYTIDANVHKWYNAASGTAGNAISFSQSMTLDASGNLLVGTTSALTSASGRGNVTINGTDAVLAFGNSNSSAGYVYAASTNLEISAASTRYINFLTNGSERARITSGGNLLVGTTSFSFSSNGVQIGADGRVWNTSNIDYNFELAGSTGNRIRFYTSAGGSGATVGSITVSTTATAYNTSSDYRLKDNAQPLTGSGAFIDALQPKTWDWKDGGGKGVGFIAHEVQEISPGSVVGAKDAVDAEGNPVMQAMEYGSAEFIANIVAELQSLRARVAQLESKGA